MLANSNFEVSDIFRDANDEYVVAFPKNSNLTALINHFVGGFSLFKENLCKLVDNFSRDNKKIGVWGAGGKSITFLSFCELTPNKIKYVVDSDPKRWNKYTLGSKIKIVPPNYLLKRPVDVIIVGAVMYQAGIIKQLKSQLKFKGPIVVLAPRPHILSVDEVIQYVRAK